MTPTRGSSSATTPSRRTRSDSARGCHRPADRRAGSDQARARTQPHEDQHRQGQTQGRGRAPQGRVRAARSPL
jgi:hypothetical protein